MIKVVRCVSYPLLCDRLPPNLVASSCLTLQVPWVREEGTRQLGASLKESQFSVKPWAEAVVSSESSTEGDSVTKLTHLVADRAQTLDGGTDEHGAAGFPQNPRDRKRSKRQTARASPSH